MSAKVKINKATLTKQVEEGMKLDALAKEYGLSKVKMRAALKLCGLRIRSFRNEAAFEIEEGDEVTNVAPPAEVEEEVEEETPVVAPPKKPKAKPAPEPTPEPEVQEEEDLFEEDTNENIFEPTASNVETESTPSDDADFEF